MTNKFSLLAPILLIFFFIFFSFDIGQAISSSRSADCLSNKWNIRCFRNREHCFDARIQPKKQTASKPTKRFSTKMNIVQDQQLEMITMMSEEGRKAFDFDCLLGNGIFLEDFCINVNLYNPATVCYSEIPFFKKQYPELNCARIVNGDGEYIREELATNGRRIEQKMDAAQQIGAMDCQSIYERHNFHLLNLTYQHFDYDEEKQFPIAFVRTVFKDYRMLEGEFAISYAPQNFYCYAIDAKSPDLFHQQIRTLAGCFPNVFVLPKEKQRKMDSGGLNQLYSAVECLKLITQPKYGWKYVILLQNHDVQLKTNQELVQIFKWMNGANDIEYTPNNIRNSFYNAGNWTLANLHLFKNESLNLRRDHAGQLLALRYSKGTFSVSLSRTFVDWMLENLNLGPMLDQLNTFFANDEHFWGVLSANEFLEAPGGFTQKCFDQKIFVTSLTRLAIWGPDNKLCQSGLWRHSVCVLGLEDVAMVQKTSYLFANKMMPQMDAGAIECIHEMIYNRTHFERGLHRLCRAYYTELPQVRYNRDKLLDPINFDVNKFNCDYKF